MAPIQEEKQYKQQVDKISSEILVKSIERAVLRVDGVFGLCDPFSENISKLISGKESIGVKVSKTKEGQLSIQIFLVVKFGVNIPQVAWEVQTSVKEAIVEIADYSDREIKDININVLGVEK